MDTRYFLIIFKFDKNKKSVTACLFPVTLGIGENGQDFLWIFVVDPRLYEVEQKHRG